MKHAMMKPASVQTLTATALSACALIASGLAVGWSAPAQAQNFPITPGQRATAEQVAQAGVPLSELAPNAPDRYTVVRGDTLWGISGLFLTNPWRWPELWGMNLQDIRNPHLIYPGQLLVLEKKDGRAMLRAVETDNIPSDTQRLSPRTRVKDLPSSALPTLQAHLIEPFLAEAMVIDEATLLSAPRIVATQEGRSLLSKGDRAYARGAAATPLQTGQGQPRQFRVFRDAKPLKDPYTGELLGYEAQYVGRSELVRGESTRETPVANGKILRDAVPATIDILSAKEEMRTGDRLLPEPPRELKNYVPHAPNGPVEGSVVSVYGNSVRYAAQNQVVVINRGTRDGMETGHVLALLKAGERIVDKTDPARPTLLLPDERNGLLMVFHAFDKVSYALILEIVDSVKVGDRLVNPR